MRKSASFNLKDPILFRQQLVKWGVKFSSFACFDTNGYAGFDSEYKFIAATGESGMAGSEKDFFSSLKNFYTTNPDWLFGFFSYDLKSETEPKIFLSPDNRFDGIQLPRGHFFKPRHIIEVDANTVIIHSVDEPQNIFDEILKIRVQPFAIASYGQLYCRTPKTEYLETVRKIQDHIAAGDIYEMNFCQEFYQEDVDIDPASIFHLLNEKSPAPFSCFLKHGNKFLISASPERFLKKKGSTLISQPMKGTLRRNSNGNEDEKLREALRNDEKERAENVMIVDLVRNDLAKSAVTGSVKVEELFGIYTFPQVYQMISTVSATLRSDVHFIDAIKNTFPMGSMTGAPKVRAMQLIDQYEKVKRGLFSGSAGYITPDGNFEFNVVIRSILYNREKKYLSFQTGSAITYGSIAKKEYDECLLKAEGIMKTLGIQFA